MGYRKIVTTKKDNDFLHKLSRDVEVFDSKLHNLLDDMKETMYKANGVGLAAPQVGLLKKICVVDTNDNYTEFVNPKIISQKGSYIDVEGCLSVLDENGEVERPREIEVEAFDRNGKPFRLVAKDLFARAICHEVDHLNGILFVDKAINTFKK